ncbi:MAG: hypothetical protein LBN05_08910 [Oscillospiraceae bacterium]|jgi:hypothetical protein|nr:hypothetical protein [Oscillospiraceae bacterium]
MKLIDFPGLNCYGNSLISIVHDFGVDYEIAFSNLWSETDFRYNPSTKAFVSKRLLASLHVLGARCTALPCATPEETASSMADLGTGACLVVGMDALHTPWNPNYGVFHGDHYFIAMTTGERQVLFYDPTYHKRKEKMPYELYLEHANELLLVEPCAKESLEIDHKSEIQNVLAQSSKTCLELRTWLEGLLEDRRADWEVPAKYVECLMNNRYLYAHYLAHRAPELLSSAQLFDESFFARWVAVKNGLIKAAIVRNNRSLIEDIVRHLSSLMELERGAAEKMQL